MCLWRSPSLVELFQVAAVNILEDEIVVDCAVGPFSFEGAMELDNVIGWPIP